MRTRSLRPLAGIAVPLAAVVIGGPAAGVASAETCTGTLSGNQQFDSLVVRDGGRCNIGPTAEVSVSGGVDVGSDARLWVRRVGRNKGVLKVGRGMSLDPRSSFLHAGRLTLRGALTGRPETVAVLDDAWIGGRVGLNAVSDHVEMQDVSIDGDVEIASGRGGTSLTKISVDGDVQIHDKRFGSINVDDSNMDRLTVVDNKVVAIRITDNIISRSLTCIRNESTGGGVFGNVVAGVERTGGC
jgi:hypothetical protein